MAGRPRYKVIRKDEVGVYHVWSRCVRQATLCGIDPLTGKDRRHRKQWIHARMADLVQIFAVEACVFAILPNHYHLILRNRIDLMQFWSDEEVVRRWWQLYPERHNESGRPAEPTELEIRSLLARPHKVAEWRHNLADISWFMKAMNEWIAVRANAEDESSGSFFQGRFGCRSLLDEAAILACSIYIDLNEVRACLAATPEESYNTSAYFRMLARVKREQRERAIDDAGATAAYEPEDPDFLLCPLPEQDFAPLLGPVGAASVIESQRCDIANQNLASAHKRWRHGFLPLSLDEYLEFLDWNARQQVPGKQGFMDDRVPPILERLGLEPKFWRRLIENFDRWFRTAAGSSAHLRAEAERTGRQWLHGVGPLSFESG